jgi:hypothetical protein
MCVFRQTLPKAGDWRRLSFWREVLVSAKSEKYREHAEEAERLATKTLDLRAAETYRLVATHYRELAELQDKQDAWGRRSAH